MLAGAGGATRVYRGRRQPRLLFSSAHARARDREAAATSHQPSWSRGRREHVRGGGGRPPARGPQCVPPHGSNAAAHASRQGAWAQVRAAGARPHMPHVRAAANPHIPAMCAAASPRVRHRSATSRDLEEAPLSLSPLRRAALRARWPDVWPDVWPWRKPRLMPPARARHSPHYRPVNDGSSSDSSPPLTPHSRRTLRSLAPAGAAFLDRKVSVVCVCFSARRAAICGATRFTARLLLAGCMLHVVTFDLCPVLRSCRNRGGLCAAAVRVGSGVASAPVVPRGARWRFG